MHAGGLRGLEVRPALPGMHMRRRQAEHDIPHSVGPTPSTLVGKAGTRRPPPRRLEISYMSEVRHQALP